MPALALVAAVQVVAFLALGTLDVLPIPRASPAPLVVELLPLPRPAPPRPEALPTSLPVRLAAVAPVVRPIVPVPVVRVPVPAPRMMAVVDASTPPIADPPILRAPAPSAPSHDPIAAEDLGAKLLKAPPPRYPIDARRRREEGTVSLLVVVAADGSVASLSVATSSGAGRLDDAALAAVRRWRWTPTMRGGVPVPVQGIVRIPFRLAD